MLLMKSKTSAGEMAQCLRSLAVLPEDLDLVPSVYMVAHNGNYNSLLAYLCSAYTWYRYIHANKNPYT